MSNLVNRFGSVRTTLTADVANNGTFTIGYPSGTAQADFANGMANAANTYIMLDDNDKISAAAGQVSVSFGASNITVTNTTGGTLKAGTRIGVYLDQTDMGPARNLQIPVKLAKVTGNITVVNALPIAASGVIEAVSVLVTDPATTASKLTTLKLQIDGVDVTGGTVALTSATVTPLGAVIQGGAITGANVVKPGSTLSVLSTGTTAFAEGEVLLNVRIRENLFNTY